MNPEKLLLGESYVFNVIIEYDDSHYAGELSLAPSSVKLKIMGEITEDRKYKIPLERIDKLRCRNLTTTFLLVGLKPTAGWNTTIERHPKHRGFFENAYDVEHVLHFSKHSVSKPMFDAIDIRSRTISAWVGHTINQDRIGLERESGAVLEHPEILTEFIVPIGSEGHIGINYNLSIFRAPAEHKAGITFPPSLTLRFVERRSPNEVIQVIEELYVLFAFITGGELELESIEALHSGGLGPFRTATVYFPREKFPRRKERRSVLFPLGRNLRFDQFNLPEFPLNSFSHYFALSVKERRYFEKYIRYRRLDNVEERFLGYFRLLETLCFKERFYFDQQALQHLSDRAKPFLVRYFADAHAVSSFLKRLPKFNAFRYNTEKCIREFFDTIPKDVVKDWELGKEGIASVCKLRNDISHANDFELDESKKMQMTSFVEILLLIALFDKLGIDLRSKENILHRYGEYSFLKPPKF